MLVAQGIALRHQHGFKRMRLLCNFFPCQPQSKPHIQAIKS